MSKSLVFLHHKCYNQDIESQSQIDEICDRFFISSIPIYYHKQNHSLSQFTLALTQF